LIILSMLQTEVISTTNTVHNWISHLTYSLLLHYLEKCNCIQYFTKPVDDILSYPPCMKWLPVVSSNGFAVYSEYDTQPNLKIGR